ncbi:MAG TPA: hypothetical protein DEP84_34805 [Chloroflexi bacterium]|nr:hypothetical protein [Chloroflexota bacterium]
MKMKKILLLLGLLLLLLASTACTSPLAPGPASTGTTTAGSQTPAGAGALSRRTHLALGTLQLEGTDLAVDQVQATDLLPLWQAAQALDESANAAEAERTALVNQIEATMTTEQRQAIDKMDLTLENVQTIRQERGLAFGSGNQNGQAAQSGEGRQGGGFVPGVPPPGGGGPELLGGPGSAGAANASRTPPAGASARGGEMMDRLTTEAVIQLLKAKTGQATE